MRTMGTGDLRFATALHLESLNHGLFPALGRRFLSAYLATFVDSPFAVALLAESGGSPVGYLVGTVDDRAHYRHVLRRHGPEMAGRGLLALVFRPSVAIRFARTRALRYARGAVRLAGKPPAGARTAPVNDAVLTHMAVVGACRGRGVGSLLVRAFVDRMSRTDLEGIRLTTRSGSKGAAGFYEKLGWCKAAEFTDQDGLDWQRLRLELVRS